jgi:hypothetical protein
MFIVQTPLHVTVGWADYLLPLLVDGESGFNGGGN